MASRRNQTIRQPLMIKQCITYLFALILASILVYSLTALAVAPINVERSLIIDFIAPELKAICAAESVGDWNAEPIQFNPDGTVLRGRINPNDIGQCQINEPTWGKTAKELGFDIYTSNGNRQIANYIYETRGNQDWKYSKAGWDKPTIP